MKKIQEILIILIIALSGKDLKAQDQYLTNYTKVRAAFIKVENKAIEERAKIVKLRFFDPIERADRFFQILQNDSPELLINTDIYKFEILSLLNDTTIQKDQFTILDIEGLLYNLCLENYLTILDTVYFKVKQQKLDFVVLEDLAIQDFNVSNLLLVNYEDTKVQNIISKIHDGIRNGEIKLPKEKTDFLENLEHTYSDEWRIFLLGSQKNVPPILHLKQ